MSQQSFLREQRENFTNLREIFPIYSAYVYADQARVCFEQIKIQMSCIIPNEMNNSQR